MGTGLRYLGIRPDVEARPGRGSEALTVSKKTNKRKARRRHKANHGRRPA